MYYVYHLQSQLYPDKFYVGFTTDLNKRMAEHNSGKSVHTKKYLPWKIVSFTGFVDKVRAEQFELYLTTSSGRAFAKKRL